MEKRLILFRHGKSDWAAPFERDHDRPVAPRGIKAAQQMGRLLAAAGQVPDRVITSSALRAKTTASLAAAAGGWGCPIAITDALYEATPAAVIQLLQQQPEDIASLMLVGHEPTWSQLTGVLTGGCQVVFPTAAMVRIDFELASWRDLPVAQGQLIWLLPPKLLTGSTS